MRTLALVAIVSSCVLMAQDADPHHVYKIGSGVSPPRLLERVEPEYSKEARIARLEGVVVLRVTVGADGKARDFAIVKGLGLGLDENATKAVAGWEFAPGLKDAQPVNVLAQIEVNFRILDRDSNPGWHLKRIEFHLPDGASRPVVNSVTAPHIEDVVASADASLNLDIDDKGVTANIAVQDALNEGFSREVAEALAHWKFKPASKDGHPISVSCTMDFVRGALP